MLKNSPGGKGNKIRYLLVTLSVALALIAPYGCGGGGDGGGSTITLSGVVVDPTSVVSDDPVAGATVSLYLASDSSLVRSTATSATGTFSISIPINTEMYLKMSKTGYASVNSRVGSLDQNITDAWFIILPTNNQMFIDLANIMSGENEAAWNSTLQSYSYVVMEVSDDTANNGAGFEITNSTPNMVTVLYATNSGGLDYTTTSPTVSGVTSGPTMVGSIDGTGLTLGRHSFMGTVSGGTLWESQIDAFLIQGEITFFTWDVM